LLKSKLQYSTNPAEKEALKQEIEEIEKRLKDIKKKNNPDQSEQPKQGYGKIIIVGAVVFLVVLVSILRFRKRKI